MNTPSSDWIYSSRSAPNLGFPARNLKCRTCLKYLFLIFGLTLGVSLAGCAFFCPRADPIDPKLEGGACSALVQGFFTAFMPTGIRYYEPAPFIIVYGPDAQRLTAQYCILPDTSKKMVVAPHAYFSSIGGLTDNTNAQIQFSNGMLCSVAYSSDSAKIPKAVVSAAKDTVTQLIQSAGSVISKGVLARSPERGEGRDGYVAIFFVFRIVPDHSGWKLVGSQGFEEIPISNITWKKETDNE